MSGDEVVEDPHRLDVRIARGLAEYAAVTDHVVGNDDGKTRTLQISASDFGVSRDEFDGDQLSVVGRGAGEADGAVAAESTDFQDAASSRHSREQLGSPA